MSNLKLKFLVLSFLIVLFSYCEVFSSDLEKIKKDLNKLFENVEIEQVIETPLKGVYAIFLKGNSLFFYNTEGYIFFGEIWSVNGTNLSVEIGLRRATDYIKEKGIIPHLSQGKGKEVYVFVNLECVHCRDLIAFLDKYTDKVKMNIFFVSFPHLRYGTDLALRVLCSDSPYESLLSLLKNVDDKSLLTKVSKCDSKIIEKYVKEMEMFRFLGISSVPVVVFKDGYVLGNDFDKLKSLIERW